MTTIQLFDVFINSTSNSGNTTIVTNGVWTLLGAPAGSNLTTGTIAGGYNPSVTLDVLGGYSFRYSALSANGCLTTRNLNVTLNDTSVSIVDNPLPCTLNADDPLVYGNSNITLAAQEEDWVPSQFIFNTVTASKGSNCILQPQGSPNSYQFSNIQMDLLQPSIKNAPTFGVGICIDGGTGVNIGIVGTTGTVSFSIRRFDTGASLSVTVPVLATDSIQQVYDKLFTAINFRIAGVTGQSLSPFPNSASSSGGFMTKIDTNDGASFAVLYYKQRNNNPWFVFDTLPNVTHSGKSSFITRIEVASGTISPVASGFNGIGTTKTTFSYRGYLDINTDCGIVDIPVDIVIATGSQATQLGFNFTGALNGTQKGLMKTQYMSFTPSSGTIFYRLLNATAVCNLTPSYSWSPAGLPQSNQTNSSSILVCAKSGTYTVTAFCGDCTDTASVTV